MMADRLARDNFINTLSKVVAHLCDSKDGCTFAINGRWGCGKSFVLELFREKIMQTIKPGGAGAPYYIFRYNCWQYDYYEEPVVAIVSALYDEIEEITNQLSQASENVKALSHMAVELTKKLAGNFLNSFLPFDMMKSLEEFEKAKKDVIAEKMEIHVYDNYFSFKEALDDLRTVLKNLSEEKPIVLLIDELDRCAPAYAVKVLERIHHIFNEQKNIVVILAIDQTHLEQSIQTVYGISDTESIADYLKKFISFSLSLDMGYLSEPKFWEKYKYYLELFEIDEVEFRGRLLELPGLLFDDIDIRTQEKIMDRIILLHKLSFPISEKANMAYLYFELLYQTLSYRFRLHYHENWESRITNPEDDSVLKQVLSPELHILIRNLERESYSNYENINPSGSPPYFVKQLKSSPLAFAFLIFAKIANSKNGKAGSIYPYQIQTPDSIFAKKGLPPSVKLFLEFSEQMEFW